MSARPLGAEPTAAAFVAELAAHTSEAEREKIARHYQGGPGSEILGVRMKRIFDTAKAFSAMPREEIEKLLDSPYYEARMGAVSIMDFQVRRKATGEQRRRELYELYLRRHDRLDSWGFVDRAAPRVIGGYLLERPKDVLYDLARSPNVWERRTAITASFYFIRAGELDDALQLSELLLLDPEEPVNRSVGTALREIGKVDERRLLDFLDRHAAEMPRVTLRHATEKLDPERRKDLISRT